MEEDIKVLEEYKEKMIKDERIHDDYRNMLTAIENLIKGYKELEEERQYEKELRLRYERRYDLAIENRQKNFIKKSRVKLEMLKEIYKNRYEEQYKSIGKRIKKDEWER